MGDSVFGDSSPICIDVGTHLTRIGFSDHYNPITYFPSVISRAINSDEVYYGEEAMHKKSLKLENLVSKSMMKNFKDLEGLLKYGFYTECRVSPEEHPLVIADQPFNTMTNREKICQLAFEQFNVPYFLLVNSAKACLTHSSGSTGVVLCSGEEETYSVCFNNGAMITNSLCKMDVGGADITLHLDKIFREKGKFSLDINEARRLKERFKVDEDFNFELSNGKVFTFDKGDTNLTDLLFNPHVFSAKENLIGMHELVHGSIIKCDVEIRDQIYNNIVLAGGNTYLGGFYERFSKELRDLVPISIEPRVRQIIGGRHTTWEGTSMLANVSPVSDWISKEMYHEEGERLVHKCFSNNI